MRLLFSSFLFIFFTTSSYAYFDPGTGMFILQGIIAIFGVIIFYLGYPVRFLKNVIKRFKQKSNKNKINYNS